MENRIRELDWVTERSECSIVKVFEMLRLQVKADVEKRNGLLPQQSYYKFEMTTQDSAFSVLSRSNINKSKAIVFELVENEIQVNDKKGNSIFVATLTLNDAGECLVKIKDKECELWQMRRAALEDLFFNTF
jgi:hypothetical protein